MTAAARRVDEWGRVIYSPERAFELLMGGQDITRLLVEDGDDVRLHNATCQTYDKIEFRLTPPSDPGCTAEEEHARRSSSWLIPEEFKSLDVRSILIDQCGTEEEVVRIHEEMDLYEARGLLPMLRAMMSLVAHFRANGVVWGVGRGSSVASYVLYRIGITRINPMQYGLRIQEFLR